MTFPICLQLSVGSSDYLQASVYLSYDVLIFRCRLPARFSAFRRFVTVSYCSSVGIFGLNLLRLNVII